MGMPFGFIFSLFLIVVFIVIAFIAIKSFLDFYQKPLVSTSANPSGQKSALSPEEVSCYFPSGIDICVDGGVLSASKGSTIVAIQDQEIQILRQGDVALADLMEVAHGKRTSI